LQRTDLSGGFAVGALLGTEHSDGVGQTAQRGETAVAHQEQSASYQEYEQRIATQGIGYRGEPLTGAIQYAAYIKGV